MQQETYTKMFTEISFIHQKPEETNVQSQI